MIKSKITGFIDLGNGPIEVQGKATTELPLPSKESVRAFNDEVRKMHERIKTFQIIHTPMGPIVDSTLAGKGEGKQ
jgi:hypothetical protein